MITLDGVDLKKCLAHVKAAIDPKSHVPALRCVKISFVAPDGPVRFLATNLDLTLEQTYFDATVDDVDGWVDVVVPFVTLEKTAALAASAKVPVTLTSTSESFQVSYGAITVALPTEPLNEFPMTDLAAEETETFTLDIDALLDVERFRSTDPSRSVILTGVSVNTSEYAATDSYRLAVSSPNTKMPSKPVLLATEFVKSVLKECVTRNTVTTDVVAVDVIENGTAIVVRTTIDGLTIYSRCVTGEFPNYASLIDKETPPILVVSDVKKFVDTLTTLAKQIKAVGMPSDPVRFRMGPDTPYLYANCAGTVVSAEVPVEFVGTKPVVGKDAGAFNPEFLLSLVEDLDEIVLCGASDVKPWHLTVKHEDRVVRRAIMPVRVS